jgi:hypothetical protein
VAAGGANNTSSTGTFNAVSKENDIVISIVDENWIGQNPDPGGIQTFIHSGIGSPFLNSSLDISIPAEMANKIINDRLGNNSQTDMTTIKTGKIFNSNTDLFLSRTGNSAETGTSGTSGTELTNEDEVKAANARKIAVEEEKIDQSKTKRILGTTSRSGATDIVTEFFDKDGKKIKTETKFFLADGTFKTATKYEALPDINAGQVAEAVTAEATAKSERITTNLEKIDVVPKPNRYKLGADLATSLPDAVQIDFFVFCLDDTDFLESMKNYYLQESRSSLSQPLPIKYSFTILGNSGIRRGDTFKISGIPRRYADNGIFQVTGIEHSMSGMRWETTVTGEYRQITPTASLAFGGGTPSASAVTESWNGSSWTTVNSLNTARTNIAGSGSQTAALAFGGGPPASAATEIWNGTSWTSNPNGLSTARWALAGAGTQTTALAFGGNTPPDSAATEEWTGPGAPVTQTITTS